MKGVCYFTVVVVGVLGGIIQVMVIKVPVFGCEIHARVIQRYVRAKIGILFMQVLFSKLLVSVG